jgi:SAM-dependent methyltransferase
VSVHDALARVRRRFDSFGAVLGWGCGHAFRHFHGTRARSFTAATTSRALFSGRPRRFPGRFAVDNLAPPLPYEADSFEMVYSLSVFTHLSEPMQQAWISELARVPRPEGPAVFSTHGDYFLSGLPAEERRGFQSGRLVVLEEDPEGSNFCHVYHPFAYVRDPMAAPNGFPLLVHMAEDARGNGNLEYYILERQP